MLSGGIMQQSNEEGDQRIGQLGLGYDKNASKQDLENIKKLKELKAKFETKKSDAGL